MQNSHGPLVGVRSGKLIEDAGRQIPERFANRCSFVVMLAIENDVILT